MPPSSFIVGLFSSLAISVITLENIRDRRLLCEEKINENELRSYIYQMKLREKIDQMKSPESYRTMSMKMYVNENIVKATREQIDKAFTTISDTFKSKE